MDLPIGAHAIASRPCQQSPARVSADRHPPPDRLRFDLTDQTSWPTLPWDGDLIWTFPATPLDRVQAFARHHCHAGRKLVVLGSTSAYDQKDHPPAELPPWIDETSPINGDLPRVQGEEYLRTHHGAIILRVAGIYGPHRNPVEWIRRGRVGPTNKFVNLIHVEDLAQLCLQALQYGQPGASYNISDGQPRRWSEICREVSSRWGVISPRQANAEETGKRILNHRALTQLRYTLRYPDLYQALRSIEGPSATPLRKTSIRRAEPGRCGRKVGQRTLPDRASGVGQGHP